MRLSSMQAFHAVHPVLLLEFRNTFGCPVEAGPMAVYHHDEFAGEVQLPTLAPNAQEKVRAAGPWISALRCLTSAHTHCVRVLVVPAAADRVRCRPELLDRPHLGRDCGFPCAAFSTPLCGCCVDGVLRLRAQERKPHRIEFVHTRSNQGLYALAPVPALPDSRRTPSASGFATPALRPEPSSARLVSVPASIPGTPAPGAFAGGSSGGQSAASLPMLPPPLVLSAPASAPGAGAGAAWLKVPSRGHSRSSSLSSSVPPSPLPAAAASASASAAAPAAVGIGASLAPSVPQTPMVGSLAGPPLQDLLFVPPHLAAPSAGRASDSSVPGTPGPGQSHGHAGAAAAAADALSQPPSSLHTAHAEEDHVALVTYRHRVHETRYRIVNNSNKALDMLIEVRSQARHTHFTFSYSQHHRTPGTELPARPKFLVGQTKNLCRFCPIVGPKRTTRMPSDCRR